MVAFAAALAPTIAPLAAGFGAAILGKANAASTMKQQNAQREYEMRVLKGERLYSQAMRDEERRYLEQATLKDRAYAAQLLTDDRDYLDRQKMADIARYESDRDFMQDRSNSLAEKSAASRGVDFTRLRDDAIKAGYNPMTALSMAHAYSTHVDYGVQGQPYSPGAAYTATAGASGGGAPSHVASGGPAGGGVSIGGGGYSASGNQPALAAGQFIAEAIQRGADSFFNTPPASDPLADALRGALQSDQMAQQVRDANIPRGTFGYDLTKVEPFKPAASVGVPPLAASRSTMMPTGEYEVGGKKMVPVRGPNEQQFAVDKTVADRFDIKPFDKLVAEDYEMLFGDMFGGGLSIYDSPIPYGKNSPLHGPPVSTRTRDYIESGSTGQPLLRNPSPKRGWMDDLYR